MAACLTGPREPRVAESSLRTPVAQRVAGLALGYEELHDRDPLRHVPVPGLLAEQREGTPEDCAALSVIGANPSDTG